MDECEASRMQTALTGINYAEDQLVVSTSSMTLQSMLIAHLILTLKTSAQACDIVTLSHKGIRCCCKNAAFTVSAGLFLEE